MSDLRKDNFVAIETPAGIIVGTVLKMMSKINSVAVILPDGTEETFLDVTIAKISKAAYTSHLAGETITTLFQAPKTVVKKAPKAKAKVDESAEPKAPKMADLARALFVEMTAVEGTERKAVIAAFIELGLTKQGANTYYYNCTVLRKAGNL